MNKSNGGEVKKVLIIDDEPEIREIIEDIVSEMGYFCIMADSLITSIGIFECNKIDIAFFDVSLNADHASELGVANGIDLLMYVRKKNFSGKAICVSGFANILENDPNLKKFDVVIQKPFKEDDIIRSLIM
ncbi:MAG: response regulator [Oligoflexia bacterium]|nr:response regulator [Oligoflexia bacterium]